MTATANVTKAACLAAARRRFGKRAFVRENKHAYSPAERQALREKQAARRAELDRLDAQAKQIGNHWPKLLEAAEFFLAVNGDEPSGTQFREAVAAARAAEDMNDERKALRKEWEENRSGLYYSRWGAGYIHSSPIGDISSTHVQADTLAELLAKIEA